MHRANPPPEILRHYERLLADRYAWMAGRVDAGSVRRAARRLRPWLPEGPDGALAVDLGCGHGLHLHALVALGWRVVGIDASRRLLEELRSYRGPRRYALRRGDLLEFRRYLAAPPRLAVCLGDTIAHLASHRDLDRLFRRVAAALPPGGVFLVEFRDQRRARTGADRVLLTKADPGRVMLTILDYGRDRIRVTDVFLDRAGPGWVARKGAYWKIRLTRAQVVGTARRAGLRRTGLESGGMTLVAFRKPSSPKRPGKSGGSSRPARRATRARPTGSVHRN